MKATHLLLLVVLIGICAITIRTVYLIRQRPEKEVGEKETVEKIEEKQEEGVLKPETSGREITDAKPGDEKVISGVLKNAEGEFLVAEKVLLYGEPLREKNYRETVTDRSGRFAFKGIETGKYYLVLSTAEFGDWYLKSIRMKEGTKLKTLELTVLEPAKVSGRVLDADAAPISDVDIAVILSFYGMEIFEDTPKFVYKQTKTDTEGNFEVSKLRPTSINVVAKREDVRKVEENISLRAGEDKIVRIVFAEEGTIAGRIKSPDGEAVSKAEIRCFGYEDPYRSRYETTSKDNGNFELRNVRKGKFHLQIISKEYVDKFIMEIEVATGKTVSLGDIFLERGKTISGVVVDEDSYPIENARVRAYIQYDRSTPRAKRYHTFITDSKTDNEGKFVITKIPEYKVQLYADHPEYIHAGLRDISGGAKDVKIVLRKGGSVYGKVYDKETNEPVPKAEVRSTINNRENREVTTHENGEYEFKSLPEGSGDFIAYTENLVSMKVEKVSIKAKESKRVDFYLAPGQKLTGLVMEKGTKVPVTGASIRAEGNKPFWIRKEPVKSDEQGRYELAGLFPQKYSLYIQADGYVRKETEYEVKKEESTLNIELEKGCTISGKVVDSEKKPIKNARVSGYVRVTRGEGGSTSYGIPESKTDSNGFFTVKNVRAGTYSLQVTHLDFATASAEEFSLASGESKDDLEIVMTRGGSVSGCVVDESGTPVEGIAVECSKIVEERGRTRRYSVEPVTSNKEGHYKFKHLQPGNYWIKIRSEKYVAELKKGIIVQEGVETENVNFSLQMGSIISGKVIGKDEKPLENVDIRCEFYSRDSMERDYKRTQTDSEGKFRLEGLRKVKYRLSVYKKGYIRYYEQAIEPPKEGLLITLTEGGSISGYVFDESGAPVEGIAVECSEMVEDRARGGRRLRHNVEPATSNKEGYYKLKGLVSGKYWMKIRSEKYVAEPKKEIIVQDGVETANVNFSLKIGSIISGKVIDKDQKPVDNAEAYCEFYSRDSMERDYKSTKTDAEGKFRLGGLRNQKYRLSVYKRGYLRYYNQAIEPPKEGLVITLTKGGIIRGKVVDSGTGNPVTRFATRVERQYEGMARGGAAILKPRYTEYEKSPDGTFEKGGLATGTYSITVYAPDFSPKRVDDVDVEEGKTTENVIINLSKGGTIQGRVSSALDGLPVQGAEISQISSGAYYGRRSEENVKTDATGQFVIENVPVGKYDFEISHKDYAPKRFDVEIQNEGDTQFVHVSLDRGLEIKGRVLTLVGSQPVNGASVWINVTGRRAYWSSGGSSHSTATDATGAFQFAGLLPGQYIIKIRHQDYADFSSKPIKVQKEFAEELTFYLSAGGRIFGTVTDKYGSPQKGIRISISGAQYRSATTDEAGSYSIDRIQEGTYSLEIRKETAGGGTYLRSSKQVKVKDGEERRVDFVLEGGYSVYGSIMAGNEPVAGARVSVRSEGDRYGFHGISAYTTADESGKYKIEGLQPGKYTAYIYGKEGFGSKRGSFEITNTDVQLDIKFSTGAVVGRVCDENGAPIAGSRVSLITMRSEDDATAMMLAWAYSGSGRTDKEGEYEIANVEAGKYQLHVKKKGYESKMIEVEKEDPDGVKRIDITLRKEIFIEGKIKTYDGLLPEYAFVVVSDANGRMITADNVRFDSSGQYRLGGLSKGSFIVTLVAQGYAPASKDILVQATENKNVNFGLEKGSSLEIVVEDTFGKPIEGATALMESGDKLTSSIIQMYSSYWRRGSSDENGILNLESLAKGSYTLKVNREGYKSSSTEIRISRTEEKIKVRLEKE